MFGVPLHRNQHTGVAQLVEYRSPKPAVGSSSLSSRAKQIDKKGIDRFPFFCVCSKHIVCIFWMTNNHLITKQKSKKIRGK